MELELVIFDMDGLMFDTEPIGAKCFKDAAREFGYIVDEEFQMGLIGMNIHDHVLKVKEKFGDDYPVFEVRALARKMRMGYFYKHGLPIKPGLKELITYLKEVGIKIAIASSSPIRLIDEYLELAKMKDIFDFVIDGDSVEHGKPDPELFLKVLAHFNIDSNKAIVLEDSTNGILASYKAKIPVICVPDLVVNKLEVLALTYKTLPSLLEVKDEIKNILGENKC